MVDTFLKSFQTKIDARLDILLSESGQLYDEVLKAARYSILNGGKRIRPAILAEFYHLCGGEDDCAMNFAAAIEMIHTYSLIHDDLPCMDDDDFRRGKPSCHKQFGETTALLAGDALLTEAFNIASKTIGIPEDRVVKALGVLASLSGVAGMIGGQVIDLKGEKEELSVQEKLEMYRLKTAALIKAAAQIGCILAGADESYETAAINYGENLGLAFQLVDDILDCEGDSALLGKPTGSDEKNDKSTLLATLGIKKCKELANEFTVSAKNSLLEFDGDTSLLLELTDYLLIRNK
ncbi:MAG: polyprenyl synthetase family protein [Ruminococcaceae bacterium]|nr:polyprenyl synthetase family protein [Oscillospiraceae bacterium]